LVHTDFEATIHASYAKAERNYHLYHVSTMEDLGLHARVKEYTDKYLTRPAKTGHDMI